MKYEEIAVNTDTLKRDISDMLEALDKIEKRTETMFAEIRALDSMWEGTAHDEFVKQVTIDYNKMKELCSVISKLIGCMQYADKQYTVCESTIRTIVNSIRV